MATKTQEGIPARELDDSTLERELERLHETRHDTFLNGTSDALAAHTERMLELEMEYARRFPQRTTPNPLRTREGSRRADGRDA
jgi:galactose mutarotase-like enzyme